MKKKRFLHFIFSDLESSVETECEVPTCRFLKFEYSSLQTEARICLEMLKQGHQIADLNYVGTNQIKL